MDSEQSSISRQQSSISRQQSSISRQQSSISRLLISCQLKSLFAVHSWPYGRKEADAGT